MTRAHPDEFQFLIEEAPAAVFIADFEGNFKHANDSACVLLGYSREELLRMRVHDLHPGDADQQRLLEARERQLRGELVSMEWDMLGKEGQRVPVAISAKMLSNGMWVAFAHDLRDRKRAEEDLRFQLDLTRQITDNATTAIFMMDDRSRCTFMNPAAEKMTGYLFEEVQGGILHDFIHHHYPDGRAYPMPECPIDRALPEEFDVVDHEDVFIRKNGEFFPVQVNAKAIRKAGVAIGTVIEVRDVTNQRETVQRLRELSSNLADADRRKDEFIATLAHELRNPLSPIRAAATLLKSSKLPPERLHWASGVIDRQVGHMARLLDDLLDVARVTRGKLTLERKPVSLSEIVGTAMEACRALLQEREHEFVSTPLTPDPTVFVDPLRVGQIVGNLLTNAAKFTPPRGRLELRGEVDGEDLRIWVADNGPGLAPDELSSIFEMFAQGRASAGAQGGLGIGLALSKALAQLHGGDISASSDGPGRGSCFVVMLPGAVRRGAAASEPGLKADVRRLRILVADDNRDAVETLSALLRTDGHDVRTAFGGREALEVAAAFRPQAAILDIGMPDLSGYEVARHLRRAAWASGLRLVALTGWGQQSDKQLAFDSGFDAHLTKPVDPHALGHLLASWFDAHSSCNSLL